MTTPTLSVITLAARQPELLIRFYEALGLERIDKPPVTYFRFHNLRLAVFAQTALENYSGLPVTPGGFYSINVADETSVNDWLQRATQAGANTRPASQTAWGGIIGSFSDPEGHVWEIVHNPKGMTP